MRYVDINADLGESFGSYTIGTDEQVLKHISSANVACGFHAGDPVIMEKTVRMAAAAGVAIGAHPGFPDLAGFGRREMKVTPDEARAYVKYQLGALMAFARAVGTRVRHVKPHGALYNMAAVDEKLALGICRGIYEVDPAMILLGLAGSKLLEATRETRLKVASEVFADRAYLSDGTLAPRSMPGSVIHDEALAIRRVVRMVREGLVESIDGKDVPIRADSICVHGDNPDAVAFVRAIQGALAREGIGVKPLSELL